VKDVYDELTEVDIKKMREEVEYRTTVLRPKLIEDVNQKYGNTVIMVTHNDAIKDMADRVVKLRDGMIRKNIINETKTPADALEW